LFYVCQLFLFLAVIFVTCFVDTNLGDPFPVTNISVETSPIFSLLTISWVDDMNSDDVCYMVNYTVLVENISLSTDSTSLCGTARSWNVTDSAVVGGVSVEVTITVGNMDRASEKRNASDTVAGGEYVWMCACTDYQKVIFVFYKMIYVCVYIYVNYIFCFNGEKKQLNFTTVCSKLKAVLKHFITYIHIV